MKTTSPLTLPLKVSRDVVIVFPTLSKVHTTPTSHLETDTHVVKLPASYPRNGAKKSLKHLQLCENKLRAPFQIWSIFNCIFEGVNIIEIYFDKYLVFPPYPNTIVTVYMMLNCTVLCTVLYSALLHCTVLH